MLLVLAICCFVATRFFKEMVDLIPEFKGAKNAEQFWDFYRNGLMHQATLKGDYSFIKDSGPIVRCWDGKFEVSPGKFARHVLRIVGSDLETFAGWISYGPPIGTVQVTA
ncbi:MAG TPA: hypothetical protein VLB87_10240, partial [Pyrinomonadaceae bacterium]|nr:hypothetical protein [Pyrinomonadaceae bacterium]